MTKLAAGCIVFRDRLSTHRMLSTLTDCEYVFLVDGKFTDYEYHTELSDDGTRELAEAYENVVLIDCPGSEVDKRNRYLQACREYGIDYLLIIDSDEYVIERNWNAFRRNLNDQMIDLDTNIYGVSCCYDGLNFGTYPRLWKNPGEMEYYRCHNIFKKISNGQIIRSPPNAKCIDGIKLAWDVSLRTREHEQKTSEYQARMMAKEKPIKRELFG